MAVKMAMATETKVKIEKQTRDFGADLIRCIATLLVLSVHFFLRNGYYNQPLNGSAMFTGTMWRWIAFTCVPLFMILTGYLQKDRTDVRKHYHSLVPILLTYLLVSLITIAFKILYVGTEQSVVAWIADVLNFKACNYSWYVEMYIGLFLFIPFVNKAIQKKNDHLVAMICLIFCTAVPAVLDKLQLFGSEFNFLPDYWMMLYPFTYYVIGAYIGRYRPKLPRKLLVAGIVAMDIIMTMLLYLTANGGKFGDGYRNQYGGLLVVMLATLIFLVLYDLEPMKPKIGVFFAKISGGSLAAYLISWIFDTLIWGPRGYYCEPTQYFQTYFVTTVPGFAASMVCGCLINWVVVKGIKIVKNRKVEKRQSH